MFVATQLCKVYNVINLINLINNLFYKLFNITIGTLEKYSLLVLLY